VGIQIGENRGLGMVGTQNSGSDQTLSLLATDYLDFGIGSKVVLQLPLQMSYNIEIKQ